MIDDRDMPSEPPPRLELAALAAEIADNSALEGDDARRLRNRIFQALIYVRGEAARAWLGSAPCQGAAEPGAAMTDEEMVCVGCGKHPSQLIEYVEAARAEPEDYDSAADYCWREEGTMNRSNGHFLCTACYVEAGMPSSRRGWVTP